GSLTGGGSLSFAQFGASLAATIDGWWNASGFNLQGTGHLAIGPASIDGSAVVSSVGLAACGTVSFTFVTESVGFGYKWDGTFNPMVGSCDIGPYTAIHRFRR